MNNLERFYVCLVSVSLKTFGAEINFYQPDVMKIRRKPESIQYTYRKLLTDVFRQK